MISLWLGYTLFGLTGCSNLKCIEVPKSRDRVMPEALFCSHLTAVSEAVELGEVSMSYVFPGKQYRMLYIFTKVLLATRGTNYKIDNFSHLEPFCRAI